MLAWCCLSALLLTVLWSQSCFSQESSHSFIYNDNFDTSQPIVRVSPAAASSMETDNDWFGFSVTVHPIDEILATDSVQEALAKTRIIVGSPRGLFPGGVSGVEADPLACADFYGTTDQSFLVNISHEQRLNCLAANLSTTGLVYQCNLNDTQCGPILGNGDPRTPDGYLFERRGNDPNIITTYIENEDGDELKQNQLMGFNVHSKDGVLVACAPFWKHVGSNGGPQPRGRCVYSSGKSLSGFTTLLPCISGNRLNQNMGGYCSTGIGIGIKKGISSTEIAIGTPGRYFSRGGVAYYEDAANHSISYGFKQATVPPSVGNLDVVGRRDYDNTPAPIKTAAYYGFSFAEGYIVNTQVTSFLVGAPRHDLLSSTGYVFILPHNNSYFNKPVDSIKGEQIGEMFGHSIIALDLNNDGYDDVVVGAPIYSGSISTEIGRIFIFENNQGNGFHNATTINGFVDYSRFGTALTSVGDINNDGYQDFAVSAPYEGSGVVYIYYGQDRDSSGSIVDSQYKQRIDGSSVVDSVFGLDEVAMFGYSLSCEVDIDNNRYNDLVVGAFESQTVFVFRSRPVASVSALVTSDFTVYDCMLNQQTVPCLNVEVCALYHSGNNVADTINTTYRLEETSTPHRFYFDTEDTTTKTGTIQLTGNISTCFNTSVHITISDQSSIPFHLTVNILSEDRPFTTVNTTFVPTTDLSESPFISSNTQILQNSSISVPIIEACTSQCNPRSNELRHEYEDCCKPENFGNFIRVMKSSLVRGYIVCPDKAPDWCP